VRGRRRWRARRLRDRTPGERVTHLVVEPRHRHGLARLVPITLAAQAEGSGSDLKLECRTSDVHRLPGVHELAYRRLSDPPMQDPDWDLGVQDLVAVPDGDFSGLSWNPGDGEPRVAVAYDGYPKATSRFAERAPSRRPTGGRSQG
jgi:hypothetical protein